MIILAENHLPTSISPWNFPWFDVTTSSISVVRLGGSFQEWYLDERLYIHFYQCELALPCYYQQICLSGDVKSDLIMCIYNHKHWQCKPLPIYQVCICNILMLFFVILLWRGSAMIPTTLEPRKPTQWTHQPWDFCLSSETRRQAARRTRARGSVFSGITGPLFLTWKNIDWLVRKKKQKNMILILL